MEKRVKFDFIFFVVLFLGVFLLIYLSLNIIEKIHSTKEVIRLIGTLILPVPLALFIRTLTISKERPVVVQTGKAILFSVLLLLITLVLVGLMIHFYEIWFGTAFKDDIILPPLINSFVIILFAINYLTKNNVVISGVLSGILLGMAIYIFFI